MGGSDFINAVLPLVIMFGIFYVLLIRPQQKKMKEHQEMLNNIRRGDKIVTSGGIIGTVTKISTDKEVLVEIADNVRVRVLRSTISDVLAKIEAANSDGPKPPKKASKESKETNEQQEQSDEVTASKE